MTQAPFLASLGHFADTRLALVSEQARWRLGGLRRRVRQPLVWMRHRDLKESDAILAEYPKSGGTWLAFMLGEAITGRSMNFINQVEWLPAVGRQSDALPILASDGYLLRTHEAFRSEYRGLRCIYLVRHIADVAVSYHRTLPWRNVSPPSFSTFLSLLLAGKVDGYGEWPNHVAMYLDAPTDVLVLRYEDLRRDPAKVLDDALGFLGISRDAGSIATAVHNNVLDQMREKERAATRSVFKDRPSGQQFVRKGTVGESLEVLSASDWERIQDWAGPTLARLGYEIQPT